MWKGNSSRARDDDDDNAALGFLDIVLSWSLKDVLNQNLYRNKVLFSLPLCTLVTGN